MAKLFFSFNVCAALVFWLGSALAALSENNLENNWEHCRPNDNCVIEFNHLATQATDPYMFSGHVVDKHSNKWLSYRRSIRNYSDVRDCLMKSEKLKEKPNLLKIDWDRVGFGHAAEVCVFRIARSLGDVESLKDWFDYHGFRINGPNNSRSESYKPRYETQPMQTLSAKWSGAVFKDRYMARKSLLFYIFANGYRIGGYAFNMRLSEDNRIVSIEANWTGKQ
ncbi:hypothetical protein [Ruegeria atlantica]|uniref:hypothetical protein n=1 Tax=Ruegeria atlantica TaxID=81569 RepID=UPI00147EEEE5|nr:hypothetical protein [Ruegeria atlantica]